MSRLLAKSSILKDSQHAERIVDCTLLSLLALPANSSESNLGSRGTATKIVPWD